MNTTKIALVGVAIAALSAGSGYWVAKNTIEKDLLVAHEAPPSTVQESSKRVLYWYDPMVPQQHFDKPGKSPFMDMQLVAKYADEGSSTTGVRIDSGVQQNLALRRATAQRKSLSQSIDVAGLVKFNERNIAVLQTRSAGFVERVYARAPGDVIAADAMIVDLLMPEWAGAQTEYLALRRNGDAELLAAARQRLLLMGMPPALIGTIERSGKPQLVITHRSPIAGVIESLEVRQGMSIGMGATLAKIVGIDTVWLEIAVPEAQAEYARVGSPLSARFNAYPEMRIKGCIIAVLPETNSDTRTLKVRAELPNPDGRLRAGMFAQVRIDSKATPLLWIPSEAVIRTGKRDLVIVDRGNASFIPVEVVTSAEAQGQTAILRGIKEGDTVVISGQFLIDSEANLTGVLQRLVHDKKTEASHD